MSNKIFPIKTDTACRLKWSWSTLFLNTGRTFSCHRASPSTIDPANFDSFHNTEQKLRARQIMLEGQWPSDGCEYCKTIEQSGGISDRMFQNQIPGVYPTELDTNPAETRVTPAVLEIYFSNTCNLKCVYCTSSLSSALQAEDRKFGENLFDRNNIVGLEFDNENRYKQLVSNFWLWFEANSYQLARIQVLGGEAMLQQDFFKLLDYFEQNPHPNLEFNLVSNLNVPTTVVERVSIQLESLLRSRKLKRVDIQVSVDCWGEGQEYVRSGFERELFERNLKLLLPKRFFKIGLLSTVCLLTIPEMENLVYKYQEWSQESKLSWYMHLVLFDNDMLSPGIFDSEYLAGKLEKVYNILPNESWDQRQTIDILSGIIQKVKSLKKNNQDAQTRLVKFLNAIDKRRKTNWRTVFPWLEKELKECGTIE